MLDKWYQELQRPPKGLRPVTYAYPPFVVDPTALLLIESIGLDKWYQGLNARQKD